MNTYFFQTTADDSGAIDAYCGLPAAPFGSYSVVATQDSTITAKTGSIAVVAGFTAAAYVQVSGGGTIPVTVGGLAMSSAVTVKVDGTAVGLTSGSPTTDASGTVGSLGVALPASLAAGSHTLTVTDAAGHVASLPLTALVPSVTPSDTHVAPGDTIAFDGSGFVPGVAVTVYLRGAYACQLSVSGNGDLTGTCTIPAGTAAGSAPLVLQQNGGAVSETITLTIS